MRFMLQAYLLFDLLLVVDGNPDFRKADKSNRVVCQWDPDHSPYGGPISGRRAIQLGLKGRESWTNGSDYVAIQDITNFVMAQHQVTMFLIGLLLCFLANISYLGCIVLNASCVFICNCSMFATEN